jgi:acyl dehydratase
VPTFFEDIVVGEVREFGSYEVTEAEIREFGERYDPQPIHTDPDVEDPVLGGLVASGWQVTAITMRLLVDGPVGEYARSVGRQVDDLQWRSPVLPGDVLSARSTVLGKRVDEGREGYGLVTTRVETLDADGTLVARFVSESMLARRPETRPATDGGVGESSQHQASASAPERGVEADPRG